MAIMLVVLPLSASSARCAIGIVGRAPAWGLCELARANGAAVEVDSGPERGTTFTCSFPVALAVAGAQPAKTRAQRHQCIA